MRFSFLASLVVAFFLDRFSKAWAVKALSSKSVPLINGLLSLRLAENKGAAFGLFSSTQGFLRELLLILLPLLVVMFLVYYGLFRSRSFLTSFSLGLIAGGALGNLYDRVFSGKVIDFIDLHFRGYRYPTFNLADLFVSIGILILILKEWKRS